jgi:probable rRNA maturation factor
MVMFSKPVPGLTQATLVRFLSRARKAVKLAGPVNVLVTGDAHMRELNHVFRKKNKPTDVLSFPPQPTKQKSGKPAPFAGDLAISADIAAANAKQLGHPLAAEIKILVLHGLLHLAGYDHETDDGAMQRKEAKLRRELRLPESLIERTVSRATTRKTKPAPRSRRP